MSDTRTNIKVGLFVTVGLVLAAALMLNFSKGRGFGAAGYDIRIRAVNAGGMKNNAAVLMAGVKVGGVTRIDLAEDGRSVVITATIDAGFRIHGDAEFVIDSAGFLGDQFIAIRPTANALPPLGDGDEVACAEPFNLQDTARAAAGFITRIDATAEKLNEALDRVDRLVLNEETLTNLSATVRNLRQVSERALVVVDRVDGLITTNAAPIGETLTNLVNFSAELGGLTDQLRGVIATNSDTIGSSLANIEAASLSLRTTLEGINEGDGMVGGLLHDPILKARTVEVMDNLAVLSSNLSRYGILYKPKPPRSQVITNRFPYPGKRIH